MLSLISYKNITFLANIKITIDSFEKISREEDSDDIDNGVVIGDIADDKLDEKKSIKEGFKSSISCLVFLIKIIRVFLNINLLIDQLIEQIDIDSSKLNRNRNIEIAIVRSAQVIISTSR